MNRGVTTGTPTRTGSEISGVRHTADEYFAGPATHLSMALEAKIVVRLDQHLCVDRTVRVVTNRAALAQCLVFENKRASLITMTLSTGLIKPRQAQPTGWFHDVSTMRIVALNTVHLAFDYRMMLRKRKLRVRLKVALKTGSGIFARIDDKPSFTTTNLHVFASGPMASFTPTLSDFRIGNEMHSGMSSRWKNSHVIRVTLKTRLVADVISPGNAGAHHDSSGGRGTGVCHPQYKKPRPCGKDRSEPPPPLREHIHTRPSHAKPCSLRLALCQRFRPTVCPPRIDRNLADDPLA